MRSQCLCRRRILRRFVGRLCIVVLMSRGAISIFLLAAQFPEAGVVSLGLYVDGAHLVVVMCS